MTIIPKKDYWNCEMWNYKEPNCKVEIWFFFFLKKAYLETLVKKPRVPGTGGQTHFICFCQSQLVLIVDNTDWG